MGQNGFIFSYPRLGIRIMTLHPITSSRSEPGRYVPQRVTSIPSAAMWRGPGWNSVFMCGGWLDFSPWMLKNRGLLGLGVGHHWLLKYAFPEARIKHARNHIADQNWPSIIRNSDCIECFILIVGASLLVWFAAGWSLNISVLFVLFIFIATRKN